MELEVSLIEYPGSERYSCGDPEPHTCAREIKRDRERPAYIQAPYETGDYFNVPDYRAST